VNSGAGEIRDLKPQLTADALGEGRGGRNQYESIQKKPVSHIRTPLYHGRGGCSMPMSGYLQQLRSKIGNDLLLLPSAAVVLHDEQGRVLLCLHSDKNIWVTPGGLIEPGEQPADAAKRETLEEIGLVVEITGIMGVYGGPDLFIDYPNGDRAAYVGIIFRGRITGGKLRPDGDEILDARYFTRDELMRVKRAAWLDTAMPVLFSPEAKPHFVVAG
jgi:8-oxo-dGTP pyrophosphatase MutT (NUDIX family)